MFGKKEIPRFGSRADAFAYMMAYLTEKGRNPMDAAREANEFASIFAKNMGMPDKTEPQAEGVDKYIQTFEKVCSYCEEHPRILEFAAGAVTFFAGLVAGKKEEQTQEIRQQDIDFDKID